MDKKQLINSLLADVLKDLPVETQFHAKIKEIVALILEGKVQLLDLVTAFLINRGAFATILHVNFDFDTSFVGVEGSVAWDLPHFRSGEHSGSSCEASGIGLVAIQLLHTRIIECFAFFILICRSSKCSLARLG